MTSKMRWPGKALGAILTLVAATTVLAQSNPAVRPQRDFSSLAGVWNGSHLEQRQGCRTASNSGFHGTYSEFRIYIDPQAGTMSIDEAGLTGLSCSWNGKRGDVNGRTVIAGSLSCSDGRGGTFESTSFYTTTTLMTMRLAIQLSGSETCSIDALLTGAHF